MNGREPETLISAAVNTLPINFAILDNEGTILYTNRAWQEFGEANDIDLRPETVGTNYLKITKQAETERAQAAAAGLSEILTGERELFEFEYPCHSPDEQRWFLMRAASFTDGNQRYVAVAHFDITNRYTYQRQLEESNERLQQFAYAASHDLQEPLRMVTGYLRLLENRYSDDLDEDAEEFIEFAVDGAERMEAMIEGLLTYSRVETQGESFDSVDLEAVLNDVLTDLSVRIDETGAEVTAELLPTVDGDASQLRQLFQNLLENALQYSGEQKPRVSISAMRNEDEWEISISDEGIGIEQDDADRVFEVLQRLHSHEEYEGSGIGLALCRRVVERHGGEIYVDSEPEEGATFSFTLPATNT
ncbi:sensor box histidine kinase (plasmid) [Natrialba magadii ATCC 43099]|uniref:histidine kinase n=1 Tax=Natrialba magadii (strain ATCC 43099 / DSM 3394 / CCM 3739 / CIP 104546 / IAM 13178 / JCM 8861 / NBRC 102185 / NCIMB 2190 / MS3) TaxID=547559 RepID=D3T229_NATMM|nr:ATP-binding protein [Natrialba magadii]ADD07638.2 sensor box histidine kinase [Natrialba magadii ATCC 43099]ELY27118.1 PAS/PAC sensor signal transduction histidine kinase [Natrialba magadii ATCC 43099]